VYWEIHVTKSTKLRLNHQKTTIKERNKSMNMKSRTVILIVLGLLALTAIGVASAQELSLLFTPSTHVDEMEFSGTIESINPEAWTIEGLTVEVVPQSEIKGIFNPGDLVKVHVWVNADGTLTIREVEHFTPGIEGNANDTDDLDDDDNGNMNTNDNDDDDDDNGNMNANDNDDDDDNGNMNANENDDDDDDDNDNLNSNHNGDDDDDDDHSNSNQNDDDDDDDDHGNSNQNDNDDDDHGNDNDDDDNDNGGDD